MARGRDFGFGFRGGISRIGRGFDPRSFDPRSFDPRLGPNPRFPGDFMPRRGPFGEYNDENYTDHRPEPGYNDDGYDDTTYHDFGYRDSGIPDPGDDRRRGLDAARRLLENANRLSQDPNAFSARVDLGLASRDAGPGGGPNTDGKRKSSSQKVVLINGTESHLLAGDDDKDSGLLTAGIDAAGETTEVSSAAKSDVLPRLLMAGWSLTGVLGPTADGLLVLVERP